MAVKAHRIVIEPTSIRGERGQYYRVYFQDAVLIEDTWNPEFEACRALVSAWCYRPPRCVAGRQEPSCDVIVPDIEEGARWTVVENATEGPVIKRWEPFPDHLQPNAVSPGRVLAPAAGIARGVESDPPPSPGKRSTAWSVWFPLAAAHYPAR